MKLKIFIAIVVIAAAVLIAFSQINRQTFAPAEDFPRKALVYVQIRDLPALIKLWNESEFKSKYLESANYNDFVNNHLGRKLASRWQEFNAAIGFSFDFGVLSSLAGNQAAIALYDVGKLEFVFIAPVSDEIFAATKFAQNQDKFTEETLSDGTLVYRVAVEADRGRQKQELIFTQTKGLFVLATSEKLLVQTLDNINGARANNRLVDEPSFKLLSEKIEPHAATVWLNQAALNDDYYFKRYWLMSDVKDLKNIRAGMFDFEMQDGKFIERRKFLLDQPAAIPPIENAEAARMLSALPPGVPFYRLQTANPKSVDEAIERTIFARRTSEEKPSRNYTSGDLSFDDYDDYSSGDYESLGEKYDETIDETVDDDAAASEETNIDFSKILQPANPRAVLTFAQPILSNAPLFAEFERAAIFHLASRESFNRDAFESAIIRKLSAQTMIDEPGAELKWQTKSENNYVWRELSLPLLNWNISYTERGGELILADSSDFLRKVLTAQNPPESEKQLPLTALTIINFEEKETAYDRIFAELNRQKLADDFFAGNVASLLDSIYKVRKIEIKEFYSQHTFDEEITVNLK